MTDDDRMAETDDAEIVERIVDILIPMEQRTDGPGLTGTGEEKIRILNLINELRERVNGAVENREDSRRTSCSSITASDDGSAGSTDAPNADDVDPAAWRYIAVDEDNDALSTNELSFSKPLGSTISRDAVRELEPLFTAAQFEQLAADVYDEWRRDEDGFVRESGRVRRAVIGFMNDLIEKISGEVADQ